MANFLGPDKIPFTEGPSVREHWSKKHFENLIEYAAGFKMSDIKLVPNAPPYIKVYGRWYPVNDHPVAPDELNPEFNIIVRPSDIDIIVGEITGSEGISSQIRGGADADFSYEFNAGRYTKRRFRCNATACMMEGDQTGITLVLRTIPDTVPGIETVGLVEEDGVTPNYILKHMFPDQGLVLFTGPTGSGKTTTLAAGIGFLLVAFPHLSVETYEDPIEFDYKSAGGRGPLVQIDVSKHLGGDFTRIAANAARRSSDIVIVGETRDRASFRGLIQLADMGMLTISTLHTRSVAETPARILNTFSADEQPEIKTSLIHSLRLIVQQRLVPTVDGRRCAVREWLAFSDKMRYELSQQQVHEMIPYLRRCTEKYGQLLMDDVLHKYEAGIIDKSVYLRMAIEDKDTIEAMDRKSTLLAKARHDYGEAMA